MPRLLSIIKNLGEMLSFRILDLLTVTIRHGTERKNIGETGQREKRVRVSRGQKEQG
jgi:hypothetical protein